MDGEGGHSIITCMLDTEVVQPYPHAPTGYTQDTSYRMPTPSTAPPAQPASTGYYYGNCY